jgi:hypothetical protein
LLGLLWLDGVGVRCGRLPLARQTLYAAFFTLLGGFVDEPVDKADRANDENQDELLFHDGLGR